MSSSFERKPRTFSPRRMSSISKELILCQRVRSVAIKACKIASDGIMHIMESSDLFERAFGLRRKSIVGLKLASAAMSGEESAIKAYESWQAWMAREHPEDLREIARYLEETVERVGKLLGDMHSGIELKEKDQTFLEQVVRDVKPVDLARQDASE